MCPCECCAVQGTGWLGGNHTEGDRAKRDHRNTEDYEVKGASTLFHPICTGAATAILPRLEPRFLEPIIPGNASGRVVRGSMALLEFERGQVAETLVCGVVTVTPAFNDRSRLTRFRNHLGNDVACRAAPDHSCSRVARTDILGPGDGIPPLTAASLRLMMPTASSTGEGVGVVRFRFPLAVVRRILRMRRPLRGSGGT